MCQSMLFRSQQIAQGVRVLTVNGEVSASSGHCCLFKSIAVKERYICQEWYRGGGAEWERTDVGPKVGGPTLTMVMQKSEQSEPLTLASRSLERLSVESPDEGGKITSQLNSISPSSLLPRALIGVFKLAGRENGVSLPSWRGWKRRRSRRRRRRSISGTGT